MWEKVYRKRDIEQGMKKGAKEKWSRKDEGLLLADEGENRKGGESGTRGTKGSMG